MFFKYGDDQSARYDKAFEEIKNLYSEPFKEQLTEEDFSQFLESDIKSGFEHYDDTAYHGMVIDLAKTRAESQKDLTLIKGNSGMYQASFYISLKPKPSTNVPTQPSANQSNLTANSSATITAGEAVTTATFNAHATDSAGNTIPVSVDTSQADLNKPGTYDVILTADNGKTMTVTLTVKAAEATTVVPKRSAVFGLKTFYLYQKPTFNKSQRIVKYSKTKRAQRPMFVVTGYAHSKAGLLRYKVKDVNHHSKTAGKTGYVTAKKDFIAPVYYQKAAKQIRVLNKSGINIYQNTDLTNQVKHVKQGKTLKVTDITNHNLTTRFILSNGQYVTANKKLVMTIK